MRELVCKNCAGQDVFDRDATYHNKMLITANRTAITDGKDCNVKIVITCHKCGAVIEEDKE